MIGVIMWKALLLLLFVGRLDNLFAGLFRCLRLTNMMLMNMNTGVVRRTVSAVYALQTFSSMNWGTHPSTTGVSPADCRYQRIITHQPYVTRDLNPQFCS
jgi:hypothetical protein